MIRNEYPRPQLQRTEWINLNGKWNFEFDDLNVGRKQKWFLNHEFSKSINVPFAFQTKLSGIHDKSFHDYMWYNRSFNIPKTWEGKRVILHFNAVDYECVVYVNGCFATKHIGGQSSFSVDITDYLTYKNEEVTVYVYDPSTDQFIPRGKQYWKEQAESIWYDRTSGIWQTVWLEAVNESHIKSFKMTPDIDNGFLNVDLRVSKIKENTKLLIEVTDEGNLIDRIEANVDLLNVKQTLNIYKNNIFSSYVHDNKKMWSPENPHLYDIEFKLLVDNNVVDEVKSYFGMRKIHSKDGIVYLNNRPYFQKLVLDQGYWKDGLLTAPSDEDFVKDIVLAKQMGFNGCRKHQKAEDPRFLYHADKLGFIVWGEMANCAHYDDTTIQKIANEWIEIIERDYNHPCIITWVPLNESWGVPFIATDKKQQEHSLALYHLVHSLDTTRFVISNDGWELTKTDICAIHNYNHGQKAEVDKYNVFKDALETKENILNYLPAGRLIYVDGFKNEGEPILLTEYGGIAYKKDSANGWGYTCVQSDDEFIDDFNRVMMAIKNSKVLVGYCYTQICDVEQEINGLLTYDRVPKVDVEIIKKINDQIGNCMLKNIK